MSSPETTPNPLTVLVGGLYHGSMRPVATGDVGDHAYIITLPSLDGSCAIDPEDMVIGEIRLDQHYYIRSYQIDWPSGVVWEYKYWLHDSLIDVIDDNESIIPLYDCFVERYFIDRSLGPDSPLISLGHGLTASKN